MRDKNNNSTDINNISKNISSSKNNWEFNPDSLIQFFILLVTFGLGIWGANSASIIKNIQFRPYLSMSSNFTGDKVETKLFNTGIVPANNVSWEIVHYLNGEKIRYASSSGEVAIITPQGNNQNDLVLDDNFNTPGDFFGLTYDQVMQAAMNGSEWKISLNLSYSGIDKEQYKLNYVSKFIPSINNFRPVSGYAN